MAETLPISTIEIPDNIHDSNRLLQACRATIRACLDVNSYDQYNAMKRAKADANRLLDHYPGGVHRDDVQQQDTIAFPPLQLVPAIEPSPEAA